MKSGLGDCIVEEDAKKKKYTSKLTLVYSRRRDAWIGNPAIGGFMNQPSGNQMYNAIFDNDVKWKIRILEVSFCAKRGYLPAIPSHQ